MRIQVLAVHHFHRPGDILGEEFLAQNPCWVEWARLKSTTPMGAPICEFIDDEPDIEPEEESIDEPISKPKQRGRPKRR